MKNIILSPSVMCADLLNLEDSVKELEMIGIDSLHVDILDGKFSPSMPLGIDTIKKLKTKTSLPFDVHIMSTNNEFFIKEMIEIGAERIAFHIESSIHVDRELNLIKNAGLKAGVAITPATPLADLEYILEKCDVVVLMLINPGFATDKGEKQVPYATRKVADLRRMIDERGLDTVIQVDGRVSLETIPQLIEAGADDLVLGSTSLFIAGNSLEQNKSNLDEVVKKGLKEENNE